MDHCARGNILHGRLASPHAKGTKCGLLPVAVVPCCKGLTTLQSSSTMQSLEASSSGLGPLSFLAISISCSSEANIAGPQVPKLGNISVKNVKCKVYQVDQVGELNRFFESCLNIDDTAYNWEQIKDAKRRRERIAMSSAEWAKGHARPQTQRLLKGVDSQWQIDHMERVDEWVECTTQVYLESHSISGKGTDDEFVSITQMNASPSGEPSGCASLASSTIEFVWDYLVEGGECLRTEEDYFADDELSVHEKPLGVSKFCTHTESAGTTRQLGQCNPQKESEGVQDLLRISRFKGFWGKVCKVDDEENSCLDMDQHSITDYKVKKPLWSGMKANKDAREQPNRQLYSRLEKLLLSCVGRVS